MKYHQFTPDREVLAARIAGNDAEARGATAPGIDASSFPGSVHDASQSVQSASGSVQGHALPADLPATIDALTALRDKAFVDAAYQVVLGREADPEGRNHLLQALRSGARDKIDILGDLRYSPEGARRGIAIAGLDWRYRLRRIGRIRGVGWVARWIEAAVRLPSLARAVQREHASVELASLEAEQHAAAIRLVQDEVRELKVMAARVATAEAMLGDLFAEARTLAGRLDAVEGDLRELRDDLTTSREEAEVIRGDVNAVRDEVSAFTKDLAALEHGFQTRFGRLARQLEAVGAAKPGHLAASVASGSGRTSANQESPLAPDDFDTLYLEFEDRFRGSRDETKRLQEVYLDVLRTAGAGTSDAPVLDVGCGRGEWLELLRERGYVARGVDQNRVMAAENRERGLEVTEGDVLEYLAALPAGSVGMVTGFHIIEHLPFGALLRLFDECRRVLRAGGCAVFETPNPENLVVSAYTFHLDPTHRHPLPPQLTEFLAFQRGFADVEILRLHPRGERGIDQALLDRWFRAPADYAVIAWKDQKGPGAA